MEVIARNLPPGMTERHVKQFFEPFLGDMGIRTYHCQKTSGKNLAKLTFTDAVAGKRFLELHGQTQPGRGGFASVRIKLFHFRKPVNISESYHPPDKFLLSSLESEETKRVSDHQNRTSNRSTTRPAKLCRAFDVRQVHCGQWTYSNQQLVYHSHFRDDRPGQMLFGRRGILIKFDPKAHNTYITPGHQIEIPYSSVESFTIGTKADPSLTLSLAEAPKLFQTPDAEDDDVTLANAMRGFGLQPRPFERKLPLKRTRITALSSWHGTVVGSCLCYRFTLSRMDDMEAIQALKQAREVPQSITWKSTVYASSFTAEMTQLNNALAGKKFEMFSFGLKFQLQMLGQNGFLPPTKVVQFMEIVKSHSKGISAGVVTKAVRRMSLEIPYAGPETEAADLSMETLSELLVKSQLAVIREDSYSSVHVEQPEHICDIYKATVTPAGVYLYGPEPEVKNRILRKYTDYTSYFLQVSFLDENHEPIRYDRSTSNEEIYYGRFRKTLEKSINIAGRPYQFLGFSHSSLRAQTCYFMAPFTMGIELLHARLVISKLGDFTKIRSPAKCAARIGQAFSQTYKAVTLPKEAFRALEDVQRNGRVFSDGVGTCSSSVLQAIHDSYGQSRALKPTLLQIRCQGAKGMISLDNRIEGHYVYFRESMVKFSGSSSNDIEICGNNFKCLPMYLNRQVIKILEDLGVEDEAFLKLQAEAVEKLRMTTESPINAGTFLKRQDIGKAAKLPWLIRELWDIGLSYEKDDFLRNIVELCVLAELRELKHRSRIRVDQGVTLYGIMDETDYLVEGQIYCSFDNEDGRSVRTGHVVITRSPALHPGDVQIVEAVDVPEESPLRALHNYLPSQLSGGDLDGDLYNVIYDKSLYPLRVAEPADYPIQTPIDIGEVVSRDHMTNFFIDFMMNDSLGRIATLHMTLADQKELGTLDPDCVLLAGLHSTAVDFSKTGIPVDLSQMPRYSSVKPDFQAPGPRVLIENTIALAKGQLPGELSDEEQEVEELGMQSRPRIRYYESQKVLGKLYRAIDEQHFFTQLQNQSKTPRGFLAGEHSHLDAVWSYVQEKTALIQWQHWYDWARDIKEDYEENLQNTMTTYSSHPPHFISEVEVFSGIIIGRNGTSNKRQRDFSVSMKEKNERDVEYTVRCILHGHSNSGTEEALERSIACLYAACNVVRVRKKVGRLVSFGWVAAGVCLREVEKFRNGMIKV